MKEVYFTWSHAVAQVESYVDFHFKAYIAQVECSLLGVMCVTQLLFTGLAIEQEKQE